MVASQKILSNTLQNFQFCCFIICTSLQTSLRWRLLIFYPFTYVEWLLIIIVVCWFAGVGFWIYLCGWLLRCGEIRNEKSVLFVVAGAFLGNWETCGWGLCLVTSFSSNSSSSFLLCRWWKQKEPFLTIPHWALYDNELNIPVRIKKLLNTSMSSEVVGFRETYSLRPMFLTMYFKGEKRKSKAS